MPEVCDLSDISEHVRAASFIAIVWRGDLTVSDFYGAMWMLLVADTFRGHGEEAGIAGDFFQFTEDDVALLDRTWRLLHDRYFGVPATATVVLHKHRDRCPDA